jgi:hypothetical protein
MGALSASYCPVVGSAGGFLGPRGVADWSGVASRRRIEPWMRFSRTRLSDIVHRNVQGDVGDSRVVGICRNRPGQLRSLGIPCVAKLVHPLMVKAGDCATPPTAVPRAGSPRAPLRLPGAAESLGRGPFKPRGAGRRRDHDRRRHALWGRRVPRRARWDPGISPDRTHTGRPS